MMYLSRLIGVLLLAAGAGMMTYGASAEPEKFRPPLGWSQLWSQPSEVLAWGVGCLVAGVLLLLLFGFRSPPPGPPRRPD